MPPRARESIDQGYRWVLPQVGMYQQNGARKVRFSSVETDRSGPALVTGAYGRQEGRAGSPCAGRCAATS